MAQMAQGTEGCESTLDGVMRQAEEQVRGLDLCNEDIGNLIRRLQQTCDFLGGAEPRTDPRKSGEDECQPDPPGRLAQTMAIQARGIEDTKKLSNRIDYVGELLARVEHLLDVSEVNAPEPEDPGINSSMAGMTPEKR